jgi:FkbM family methyltransferase
MSTWRLNWVFNEVSRPSSFRRHAEVLASPLKFWLAVAAKLIPGLWKASIQLRLKHGGVVNVGEFMTINIYREIFVERCYDTPALGSDEPSIIDVGANTGLFAVRMKQLYPRARVHCYEPLPANFVRLQATVAQSGLRDCRLFNSGVAGSARKAPLFVHPTNIGGHSILASQAPGQQKVEIDLLSMTTALDRLGGRPCSLLKLDCEGAEYEILKSLDAVTAQRIEKIVFEATPGLYELAELSGHLESLGYRVEKNGSTHAAIREPA